MDNEKPNKNVKIIKDALGRTISRDSDRTYFVHLPKPVSNVSAFFKLIEDELKKKGFVKLFLNAPSSKVAVARVKIKPKSKIACTSIPQHFALLNKVITADPNDDLTKHEWKTIYYCGYSGVYNPSEDHIRFNDIDGLSFSGSEFKV